MSAWKKIILAVLVCMVAVASQAMTEDKKAKKYFMKALEIMQAGDLEKAAEQFTKALERDPGFYEAYLEYGRMLARDGRYDESNTQLKKAMDLAPEDDLTALGLLCAVAREQKDLDNQAAYMLQRLELLGDKATPTDIGLVDALGIEFAQAGQIEKAESTYRKLIELKPDYTYGYLNLGKIFLFMVKDQEKATLLFEQAVEQGIDNEEVDYILGMLYHDANKYDAALPLLQKSMNKTDYRKDALPMVINCQIKLEDLQGAKASCEAFLNEFPAAESRQAVEDRLKKINNNIKVLANQESKEN